MMASPKLKDLCSSMKFEKCCSAMTVFGRAFAFRNSLEPKSVVLCGSDLVVFESWSQLLASTTYLYPHFSLQILEYAILQCSTLGVKLRRLYLYLD
jgi:hypothetical protein